MATITINKQPASTNAVIGNSVQLSVTAAVDPTAALTYQWYRNGEALTGKTAATLDIESSKTVSQAVYYVVVSSAGADDVTSDNAVVAFTLPAYITGNFANDYVAMCSDEIQARFKELQALWRITIPKDDKVLRSEQLRLLMTAI